MGLETYEKPSTITPTPTFKIPPKTKKAITTSIAIINAVTARNHEVMEQYTSQFPEACIYELALIAYFHA